MWIMWYVYWTRAACCGDAFPVYRLPPSPYIASHPPTPPPLLCLLLPDIQIKNPLYEPGTIPQHTSMFLRRLDATVESLPFFA